jgi:uncharacterized protein YdaU (DUF1376 family)
VHYYQMNIGDYASHSSHLEPMEDLAYRRLLDFYYLHEQPIPNDIQAISRKIRMASYSTDVERVLNEFFTLVEGVWINARADEEIAMFHSKKKQASEAGKASAAARAAKSNGRSTGVQPNKNHKPITNNKKHTCEVSHFDEFWAAYPKKKNKGDAEKAWKALKPKADLLKTILEAVEVAKRGDDWRKENGQFIPYPATWLRAKGWEDEPQMPVPQRKGVVL